MKKDGFTLIETMVSIFILTILFSVGLSQSKFKENVSHGMEETDCFYEIQNLISYGKAMCRAKNNNGEISIDSSKNEIRFIEGWDNIEKIIKLPEEIIIIDRYKIIQISFEGKIKQGYTIKLIDKSGKRQNIPISVGGDLITIEKSNSL